MPHHHFRLLHFTLGGNLSDMYATIFLRTFAVSLIGIFVPIYLLEEIGASFGEVLIYLLFVYVFLFFGYIAGALLSSKIKIKNLILLSIPSFIFYYFLLYNLTNFNIPLALVGAIYGLSDGIFWFGYNTDFAKFSDKKHRGEEVKFYFVLAASIGVVGPFLGGFLLSYWNFYIIFIIVILLFLLSMFPLFKIKEKNSSIRVSLKDVFRKENYENSPIYLIQGFRTLISGVFWPIFIFYIVGGYFSLGLVFSGGSIFAFSIIWFAGNKIDKINKVLFSDFSSMLHGLVSFIRVFVNSFAQIFFVSFLSLVTFGICEISNNALAFDQANKSKIMGFLVFREILLAVGRVIIVLIILFSGLSLMASLKLSFIILGITSIFQKFYNKN